MNANPQRREWFFPIEEAPVLVAVTHKGVARDVRVPHKKALIAANTGDILGIVGAGYKVFTNQQAVTLCHKFCLEAFPDTTPAEWTFVEGHGPGTRSWAAMDIHHRAHAMNLMGNDGGPSETFTPFVRITNSYNGSRALRIDVGFLREHCSNGVIFEQEAATLTVPHNRQGIHSLKVARPFAGMSALRDEFSKTLTVTLSLSGDTANTEVSIPASVIIPAGGLAASFPVAALTDGVVDGDKAVSIIGDATGYRTGLASVTITDINMNPGGSSIAISGTGSYDQGFDTLPDIGSTVWTDNTTLPSWYAQRTGSGTSLSASNGSSTAGDLYSYGTSLVDRALGSLGSGNAAAGGFAWGVSFQNATDRTAILGNLAFAGEQWRYISSAAAQTITFSYQIGTAVVSNLTPGSDAGWTAISALSFTSPVTAGTTGARDGNDAANRVELSAILNLQLLPGECITFRWRDIDHSGTDHGLAIDDFRVNWVVPPAPLPPEITSSLAASAQAGVGFNYVITADNAPTFFEAESLPDGLSINGSTGVISGIPLQAGQFDVTLVAGSDAGIDLATLVLTVVEAETRFATWSGGRESTPDLLQAYALGGASGPGGTSEPSAVAVNAELFVVTAIVRVDDPGLTVVGEACGDLSQFGNPAAITLVSGTAVGVGQAGVPVGCQRQEFRIATAGNVRWFMRLRIQVGP